MKKESWSFLVLMVLFYSLIFGLRFLGLVRFSFSFIFLVWPSGILGGSGSFVYMLLDHDLCAS